MKQHKQKHQPRSAERVKDLEHRLHRMTGQLQGIEKMLEENRYCGDILNQIAAVEKALQSFGYEVLQEHMESCVVEEIQEGNPSIVEETVALIRKLNV